MLICNHFPAKSRIAENDAPEIKVFLLLFLQKKKTLAVLCSNRHRTPSI
jgi:rhodanese-related sulfurtransferase